MTHEHSQGGHSGHTHRHDHASTGNDTDPVCGMTVKPDSPYRVIHAGHEYRFCSAKCQGKFETDPARYLAPETSQPSTEPAPVPGTEYLPDASGDPPDWTGHLPEMRYDTRAGDAGS